MLKSMGTKLVAYDGTESSQKAVERATGLLLADDELLLLMVVPTEAIAELAEIPPDVTLQSAQETVAAEVAELRKRNVNVRGLVKEGDIADEILKLASEIGVDLIVIGHSGVSKVGRFAVANVAEQVYKRSERPVLIVK